MGSICSSHGPGWRRRGQIPSSLGNCHFCPQGTRTRPRWGPAAALGPALSILSPYTKFCHPPPPGHPPAPAPPEPSASLNCLRGFASLCLISLPCKIRTREAKREMMLDCLASGLLLGGKMERCSDLRAWSIPPRRTSRRNGTRTPTKRQHRSNSQLQPFPDRLSLWPCSHKSSPGYSRSRGSKAELSWEHVALAAPPAPICTAFVSAAFEPRFPSSLLQRNALVATLL